jgi:dTDP-4-amino-4,6-dideoxygalactose transaminase
MKKPIVFNKPYLVPEAEEYVINAIRSGRHCGNYDWNEKCISFMKNKYGFGEVFMVPSGTDALEMGVMLAGITYGDEVILPSYTFSSTATAVMLNGGIPIFCEIDPNTLNLDINELESLITPKTKMIIPIDYAGISCEVNKIMEIGYKYDITIMVDCAQSLNSKDKIGNWCGSVSPLAAFSFHETKNFGCGEGGALVVNNPDLVRRAHFLQEKGTDRRLVLDGVQSKYGWVDKGSSYLLSDILAAILYGQFQKMDEITTLRSKVTKAYHELLKPFVKKKYVTTPSISCTENSNHHAYWCIFDSIENRRNFLANLKSIFEINAYIGYVPLHSFKKGIELGYKPEDLPITEDIASRVVRLPIYPDLGKSDGDLTYVIKSMRSVLNGIYHL